MQRRREHYFGLQTTGKESGRADREHAHDNSGDVSDDEQGAKGENDDGQIAFALPMRIRMTSPGAVTTNFSDKQSKCYF